MQRKRFALALIVLTLIIYAVLALVYQDFVRENIVVPVASLVWMAALVIRSIPQAMLLTILILAGFAIAVMGLQQIWEDAPRLKMPAAPRSGQSRYRFWLRRYRNMHRSAYYLDDVSSEMRRLILRVLSSQEHRAASEIEDLVIQGALDVPPAVYAIIANRHLAELDDSDARNNFFSRLQEHLRQRFALGKPPNRDEIDHRLEQVISYLEDRLEGTQ